MLSKFNKLIGVIFFSTLFFNGCGISLNNLNNPNNKPQIDKDARYIRDNYLLLKKMNINLSNFNEKEVILHYLKKLIYKTYSEKFFIKQRIFDSDNISVFTLTLKEPFWKSYKKFLINKRCSSSFKDLKELENYMKNPTPGLAYQYGLIIQAINRNCYYIRKGGGNCNIIHNINDLHKLYKKDYEKCVNKYKNDNTFRQAKILIEIKRKEIGHVNVLIIYIIKKRLSDNNTIVEKYLALKNNKKLYILSLNKKSRFSKILNKKLKLLSYDDLKAIKYIFN